jgi:propionate CoA-transferase
VFRLTNSTAILGTLRQFAWYRGSGVDIAFLGFAEVDAAGNVNVSKLGSAIIGTGGFIDIAQKARKVVFCGTLAARGGKPKFVPAVRQVTFSGAHAISTGQDVLYVTGAAVFRLTAHGLQLEEVAPGLDPERDVIAKMAFRPLFGASVGSIRAELFAPPLLPADCFPAFQ